MKISWPPVIYFRNYGRCFLGRCARFGIDVILAPVGLATWQLGYHSFIMKDAFNLKLLQQEDIDKTNKSWSFSFYSTWNHLGTYWPDTCHIWGSIYPETQHFRKFCDMMKIQCLSCCLMDEPSESDIWRRFCFFLLNFLGFTRFLLIFALNLLTSSLFFWIFWFFFLKILMGMNIPAKIYDYCSFPSGNIRVMQFCITPPPRWVSENPPR